MILVPAAVILLVNNRMPALTVPRQVMPSPNARDFFLRAAGKACYPGGILPGSPPVTPAKGLRLVKADAPAIATLRQGFRYAYGEVADPLQSNSGNASLRSLARSLWADSVYYAAAQRWDEANEVALDALQSGEMMPRGGGLISRLTGLAICAIGRIPLPGLVNHVSAREARAAAMRLADIEAEYVPYADTLREDKWYTVRLLQDDMREWDWAKGYWDDESTGFSGRTHNAYVVGSMALAGRAGVMRTYADFMDGQIAAADRPYSPRNPWPQPASDVVSQQVCSAFPVAYIRVLTDQAQNRLLMVMFALRAYRLERGGYPPTLQELVTSGYIKTVPVDPFLPLQPLTYHTSGASFALYSVGPDGVDNGGRPIYNAAAIGISGSRKAAYRVQPESKGDIVAGVNY
jgi:hypothetical protein